MFKHFRFNLILIALLLLLAVVLAACGGEEATDADGADESPVEEDNGEEEEEEEPADGEPKVGGTLVGAMNTAPAGVFNPVFYEEAYEANILDFTHDGLFSQNNDLEFEPNLAKEWELNDEQTEMTIYLEEGVKWHDGEEFTAHDVVFTYQTIADPDYVAAGGVRSSYVAPLVGAEEYTAGETDEFEGVVAEDDYTVKFFFNEPNVTPEDTAGFTPIPKHVFEDIPVADMPEAPETLDPGKVIGTGPFKFTEMVEREQYVLERFDDFWQGAPYLDKVVWEIVSDSVMASLLEKGEIDFVANPGGISPSDFDMVSEYENIEIIEQPDFGYQLLGFKHNHRTDEDVEAGVIEPDNWVENEKLSDPNVRQALAYAVNREGIVDGLLHGHGEPMDSPIALQFWAYDADAGTSYTYDPDLAGEMLDEAGYEVGDDGFRTDPDGNEWVLNMHYPLGNELREKAAPLIQQQLEEVGVNVELHQPKEMSAYVEDLTNDNTDWDLYLIGWSLGSADPDPLGLWGITDAYNFSRWNNPDSEELLHNALKAPEAFEQDYRADVYSDWQKLFSEDLPALLLFAENKIWAHNKDLQNVDPRPYSMLGNSHLWWLDDSDE